MFISANGSVAALDGLFQLHDRQRKRAAHKDRPNRIKFGLNA